MNPRASERTREPVTAQASPRTRQGASVAPSLDVVGPRKKESGKAEASFEPWVFERYSCTPCTPVRSRARAVTCCWGGTLWT